MSDARARLASCCYRDAAAASIEEEGLPQADVSDNRRLAVSPPTTLSTDELARLCTRAAGRSRTRAGTQAERGQHGGFISNPVKRGRCGGAR